MTTPKPAPGKPLTFTPPVFIKSETKSSELPAFEKSKKFKLKGQRPNIVIVDEIIHKDDSVELEVGHTKDREVKKDAETPKKPFVLNPHLTQRPFHDDRLMQLKNRLQRPSFKNR